MLAKKSEENRKTVAQDYLNKAKLFLEKIKNYEFSLETEKDLFILVEMEYYISMLKKHIDLFERRVIKGEVIAHSEKVFSIFETYTEWINKAKQNQNIELGKMLAITTDQYNLIIDYQNMENETNKGGACDIGTRILTKYGSIGSHSFDKGYYTKTNKELSSLFISKLIMTKKGKLNKAEHEEEHKKIFKKLRNKHSAVETNINKLEHRGLDRCPDRGYIGFKRYIGMCIQSS